MLSLEQTYAYTGLSELQTVANGRRLSVASDCSGKTETREFFKGRALEPEVTAKALRGVSEIVGSRFYVPPAMLARILREADPVATVSPGAVRFEGFSSCCSTYVRLDMLDEALEADVRQNGTTNVDFGAKLRAALAQVRGNSRLEIVIGPNAVEISHDQATVIERKVPLPLRWIKGFGDVQVHMAGMRPAFSMTRTAAQRFLRSLPRSASSHCHWISLSGPTVRTMARKTPGAVPLKGAQRLHILERLVAFATAMQVYVNDSFESTAWVLDFGSQRLSLVLNAAPWRGFSGDGGLLSLLAASNDEAVAAVRAQLNWQDRLDRPSITKATGLQPERIEAALARLASLGLLGFDLATGAYFHRVLPFTLDCVPSLNPRLVAARALVDDGAVELALDRDLARVASGDVVHEVRILADGMRCTCPWYAKYKGGRGPCKHALAVEILMDSQL